MNLRDPKHETYAARLEWAAERAAIMEFDGGLPRGEAEALAASAWNVRMIDVQRYLEARQ